MSSIAASHSETRVSSIGDWIEAMANYVFGLGLVVVLLASALNLTWNSLAALIGPLDSVGGFWTCVLVVLGAYVASQVYDAARSHDTVNLFDDFGGATLFAGKMGAVVLVAYIVANYLA